VRVEYSLTPLGWQLTEPLMALYEWAEAHEDELAAARAAARDEPTSAEATFNLFPAVA
jgi:DNA-binding HxlR family transcriptional regulator